MPSSNTLIAREPVAYLLDEREASGDPTNYWIFSEAGLERILNRAGWDVCDYATTGCRRGSDPASEAGDERAFCLLRSRVADPWCTIQLLRGWHEMEQGSWRWTRREFTARLAVQQRPLEKSALTFSFFVPEQLLAAGGEQVVISATVNGCRLPRTAYDTPGEHVYEHVVPAEAWSQPETAELTVTFVADRPRPSVGTDERDLGVVVRFCEPGGDPATSIAPIRLRSAVV